jgi:hypothetical protein
MDTDPDYLAYLLEEARHVTRQALERLRDLHQRYPDGLPDDAVADVCRQALDEVRTRQAS